MLVSKVYTSSILLMAGSAAAAPAPAPAPQLLPLLGDLLEGLTTLLPGIPAVLITTLGGLIKDIDDFIIPNNITARKGSPEHRQPGNPKRDAAELDLLERGVISEDDLVELVARQATSLTYDHLQALSMHNQARQQVNVPALGWDFSLQSAAYAYAQQMAASGVFAHSPSSSRPGQGENLAYASSTGPIANPISIGTKQWLDEKVFYNNQPIPQGNFEAYGHYTQCTWNSSVRVGIATAFDGKGAWYTVARYGPPGNYAGQTPYNV